MAAPCPAVAVRRGVNGAGRGTRERRGEEVFEGERRVGAVNLRACGERYWVVGLRLVSGKTRGRRTTHADARFPAVSLHAPWCGAVHIKWHPLAALATQRARDGCRHARPLFSHTAPTSLADSTGADNVAAARATSPIRGAKRRAVGAARSAPGCDAHERCVGDCPLV